MQSSLINDIIIYPLVRNNFLPNKYFLKTTKWVKQETISEKKNG